MNIDFRKYLSTYSSMCSLKRHTIWDSNLHIYYHKPWLQNPESFCIHSTTVVFWVRVCLWRHCNGVSYNGTVASCCRNEQNTSDIRLLGYERKAIAFWSYKQIHYLPFSFNMRNKVVASRPQLCSTHSSGLIINAMWARTFTDPLPRSPYTRHMS